METAETVDGKKLRREDRRAKQRGPVCRLLRMGSHSGGEAGAWKRGGSCPEALAEGGRKG